MDIKEQLEGIEQKLEAKAANDAKQAAESALKEVKDQLKSAEEKATNAEKEVTELKAWQIKKDEADKLNQAALDKMIAEKKSGKISGAPDKTFNQILGETIDRNADAIRNFRPHGGELRFDMMPEVKANAKGEREVKDVGDMSITANFPGATTLYQDVRGLIETPYQMTYIADLLPGGSSTGTQLAYPKENGGEGAAAVWPGPSENKAQIDWDLTTMTVPFQWIAGWVVVERTMLDDIDWIRSYIQSRMLVSLKSAENTFVVDGYSTTNPGLQDVASPYNGSLSNPVDRAIDASYGQIPDATHEWYNGNLIIVRKRDLVTKIALNKASGSGEYDLPAGAVVFNPDGTVRIGNLRVVGTTAIPYDTFYALDTRATAFVRRLNPELRMFEDATLAKKNQIMFRIEERAALAIFNNAAIVKGVLQTS